MTNEAALARALDVIARRCPRGIAKLEGKAPAPTDAELHTAALYRPSTRGAGVRVNGGKVRTIADDAAAFVELFSVLDGYQWQEITDAVQWYADCPLTSRDWSIYREWVRLEGLPRAYGQGAMCDMIADRRNVSAKTVYRICRRVPVALARLVIQGLCSTDA